MLENKIHSNQIKSISEIENDFKQIEQKLNENYSEFNFKKEMIK